MLNTILKFLNYWYFRYLLVTELYMVEKWERIMIHIVFFVIFSVISLFNTKVILEIISYLTQSLFSQEQMLMNGNQPTPITNIEL